MNIRKKVKSLLDGSPVLLAMADSVWNYGKKIYFRLYFYKKKPLNERLVLFESYIARKYADSPRALYEAMLSDPAYASYEKVWCFQDPEKYRHLFTDPATRLVAYRSREYYEAISRAKYWITNYHMESCIKKRPDQIYVQTWHGTPMKRLGCDLSFKNRSFIEKHKARSQYICDGKKIDFLLSPSPFYSEKMSGAFQLNKQAKILEEGYPRNDCLFTTDRQQQEELRRKLGIPNNRKVILYAPTWRENQHEKNLGFTYKLELDLEALKRELKDEYIVLLRLHYIANNSIKDLADDEFYFDVSDYDDVTELYTITDLLLTDYSSVCFDYANLKKPMLFYMYDYQEYRSRQNGFYFPVSELPGRKIRKKTDGLGRLIAKSMKDFEYDQSYREFNEKFNPHPAPCSAEVLKKIFEKNNG